LRGTITGGMTPERFAIDALDMVGKLL